jgi:hypothetical protein
MQSLWKSKGKELRKWNITITTYNYNELMNEMSRKKSEGGGMN